MLSNIGISLFGYENTRERQVQLIKVYDYVYSRLLSISFCTYLMRRPFFSRAIPTYGVLPYSMILIHCVAGEPTCSTVFYQYKRDADHLKHKQQLEDDRPLGNEIIIIIIYSCCCRSAYAIDHAPTDAGGACKTSSQRTRARTTRDHTILITIQFLLPSLPYQ